MTWVCTPLMVSLPIACHQEQSQSHKSCVVAWKPHIHCPVLSFRASREAAQRSGPGLQGPAYGSLLFVATNAIPLVGPVPTSHSAPQPAAVAPVEPPPSIAVHWADWSA